MKIVLLIQSSDMRRNRGHGEDKKGGSLEPDDQVNIRTKYLAHLLQVSEVLQHLGSAAYGRAKLITISMLLVQGEHVEPKWQ